MIHDQSADDIRGLFDWRNAAPRAGQADGAAAADVDNDDLALALQLLSCNVLDRQQFTATHGSAAAA